MSPPPPTPKTPRTASRGRLWVLLLYCLFLFSCSAFLYRAALWSQSAGYARVGQRATLVSLSLVGVLFLSQLLRALLRKRYIHLLFLWIVICCFFPAYFNLGPSSLERFHFLLYGMLGWLIFWTLAPERHSLRFYLISVNLLLAVSCLDEILQGWVAGRYYDIRDIWINLFSGVIGLLAFRMMDLNAPLPLHPEDKHAGAARTRKTPPIIDLHIFWTDIVLLCPFIAVLLFNAWVTQPPPRAAFAGQWCDRATGTWEMELRETGEARIRFPQCDASRMTEPEGNRMDGFRIHFIDPDGGSGAPGEEDDPCRKGLRDSLQWRRDGGNRWFLYRPDLGRLDRVRP